MSSDSPDTRSRQPTSSERLTSMATPDCERSGGFESPPDTSRREFLRSAGRYTAAGALGALTLLAVRQSGAACQRPFVCGQCPVYGGCDLPKAMDYRGASARSAGGLAVEEGRP